MNFITASIQEKFKKSTKTGNKIHRNEEEKQRKLIFVSLKTQNNIKSVKRTYAQFLRRDIAFFKSKNNIK